jgi:predicted enzyme related to lactoylglutathione lyase
MQVERFGVYVVVDQIDRSAAFYRRLFSVQPEIAMPALVGFNLGGAFFGVVAKDVYAPHVQRGNNAIPYIKLRNVEAFFEHVKQVAPESLASAQVSVEGVFRFFKLKDPDGNVLEFFSITTSTP